MGGRGALLVVGGSGITPTLLPGVTDPIVVASGAEHCTLAVTAP